MASDAKTSKAGSDEIDLAEVDEIVGIWSPSIETGDSIRTGAERLVPVLQAIQGRFRYLPPEAMARLGELTGLSLSRIAGVASFYSQFRFTPVGRHLIRVCHGTACYVRGAEEITGSILRHLGIPEGSDTDEGRVFTVEKVACLGCCSLAPCMLVDDVTYGHLTPKIAPEAVEDFLKQHEEED